MPRVYRFQAIDDQGRSLRDTIAADSAEHAHELLRQRELTVLGLEALATDADSASLHDASVEYASTGDAATQAVTEVMRATLHNVPIQPALRALASDMPPGQMRRRLNRVCHRLDAGAPLESALANLGGKRQAHLTELIRTGVEHGQLPFVLSQLLRLSGRDRDLWRGIWMSLGYAMALVALSFCVSLFLVGWIVPGFKDLFEGFGVELPALTLVVLTLSDFVQAFGLQLAIGFAVLILLAFLVFSLGKLRVLGLEALDVFLRRTLYLIPVVGKIVLYASLSRFCSLLSMLLTTGVPLPRALELAGAGSEDANLADGCRRLARESEAGEPLVSASRRIPHFPRELAHLFRWERHGSAFCEALEATGELYAARSNVQVGVIAIFLEPLLLVVAGLTVGIVVIALFLPLIKLLNDLS